MILRTLLRSWVGLRGRELPVLNLKERDVETGLDYFLARYCF